MNSLFFAQNGFEFTPTVMAIFIAISIWSLAWKGIALWKAAQLHHLNWFVVILILNTFGILDIIYIYFVARPRKKSGE